jgi:hypothetical protein
MIKLTTILQELTSKQKVFASRAIKKKLDKISPSAPYIEKKQEVKNIEYFQQLLDRSSISPFNKKLVQGVINSIKKQGSLASSNQLVILQKLKNGMLS